MIEYKIESADPRNGYVAIEQIEQKSLRGITLVGADAKRLPIGKIVARSETAKPEYTVGTVVMWPEMCGWEANYLGMRVRYLKAEADREGIRGEDDIVAIVKVSEEEVDLSQSTSVESADDKCNECDIAVDGSGASEEPTLVISNS